LQYEKYQREQGKRPKTLPNNLSRSLKTVYFGQKIPDYIRQRKNKRTSVKGKRNSKKRETQINDFCRRRDITRYEYDYEKNRYYVYITELSKRRHKTPRFVKAGSTRLPPPP
jgi:hypothetical protein